MTYRRRQPGSARFDPYFKVQFFRPLDFSWQDVQERFDTAEQATRAYPPGEVCRLMRITERGRGPVEGSMTAEACEPCAERGNMHPAADSIDGVAVCAAHARHWQEG